MPTAGKRKSIIYNNNNKNKRYYTSGLPVLSVSSLVHIHLSFSSVFFFVVVLVTIVVVFMHLTVLTFGRCGTEINTITATVLI